MASPYTQQVLKVIVAQVCQTIGWNSIQTTPLELLGDILHKYLQEISHQTHRYSELYGRTEPNLDDVALAFRDMNVNLSDLEEYVSNVDPVPCAIEVPKFPLPKDNHLNFLKPGSKEVVTRPVHVNEHLPAMFPDKEEDQKPSVDALELNGDQNMEKSLQSDEKDSIKPPEQLDSLRLRTEAETRLTREITSVMMTTSGFISPAREGKLPDSKAPIIQPDFVKPSIVKEPPATTPETQNNGLANGGSNNNNHIEKKSKKKSLGGDKEKKKDKVFKELFKQKIAPMGPPPPKTMPPPAMAMYPPSNSPMAAIIEQQNIQNKSKKSSALAKTLKKHKHKDPNKILANKGEGKISKKRKKLLDKKLIDKSWDMSIMGIDPLTNKHILSHTGNELKNNIKTEKLDERLLGTIKEEIVKEHRQFPFNSENGVPSIAPQTADDSKMIHPVFDQPPLYPGPDHLLPVKPIEGKIASEPDKKKLNIIKRISSKNKEEPSKASIPSFNLPETSIFPIDDNNKSVTVYPLPTHTKKNSPKKNAMNLNNKKIDDMTKQLIESNFSPDNLLPRHLGPNGPHQYLPLPQNDMFNTKKITKKEPKEPKVKKVREKKPPKIREKKLKQQINEWPTNIIPDIITVVPPPVSISQNSPQIPPIVKAPPRKSAHLPPTLGNIDDPAFDQFGGINPAAMAGGLGNFMFPFGFGAPQPGLIPNNFYPPFPNQFNVGPSRFGIPNLDIMNNFHHLKRPRIDTLDEPPPIPLETVKAQCNVAPLVPASLKFDEINSPVTPNKSHRISDSNIKDTPPTPTFVTHQDQSPLSSYSKSNLQLVSSPPHGRTASDQLNANKELNPINNSHNKSHQHMDVLKLLSPPLLNSYDDIPITPGSGKRQRSQSMSPLSHSGAISISDDADSSSNTAIKEKGSKSEKRKDKEHKKEKKDKEGKLKKKKDKKDKQKNKEKSEKRKEKLEKKREREHLKEKTKKEKREKKKEKVRAAAQAAAVTTVGGIIDLGGDSNISSPRSAMDSDSSVPKLTLKLGSGSGSAAESPRPITPDIHRKLTIKPIKKDKMSHDDFDDKNILIDSDVNREQSPELARISALVTRPPKQKTPSLNDSGSFSQQIFSSSNEQSTSYDFNSGDEVNNTLREDEYKYNQHNSYTEQYPNKPIMYTNNTSITQQQYSRSNDHGANNNNKINSSSNSGIQHNNSNSYRTSPAPTSVQSQSTPSTMCVQSPQGISPQTTIVPQLSQSRQSSYIKKDIAKHTNETAIADLSKDVSNSKQSHNSTTPAPTRGRPKGSTAAAIAASAAAKEAAAAAALAAAGSGCVGIVPAVAPTIVPKNDVSTVTGASPKSIQRKMNPPKINDGDGKPSKSSIHGTTIKAAKSNPADKTTVHSSSGSTSSSAIGVRDSDGNQVWICPACGRVDDGTPMIGCDGCDAWYHWVCVGIQVPPDTNEDWYCRVCIAKKQECHSGDKKKKRKKKDKKDY